MSQTMQERNILGTGLNETFPIPEILVYESRSRQGGLTLGLHRRETDDGLVSYPTHGRRATGRQ